MLQSVSARSMAQSIPGVIARKANSVNALLAPDLPCAGFLVFGMRVLYWA